MKLVYSLNKATEVKVGDSVMTRNGACVVHSIEKPHKPSSIGRVYVKQAGATFSQGYFPSVIGAEWVGREDQG